MTDNEGTVVAVCLSETGGVPKYPQATVLVGPFGVEGDHHAGEYDKKGQLNHRHVTVVAQEALDQVGAELDVTVSAGGLGENILVQGVGNLGEIRPGARLHFSSGVELEVTGQNDPCNNLSVYHRLAVKHFYGKRGLLTTVVTSGPLSPGDRVSIG